MFLKAVCDGEDCLVNTDYIMEVYDLNEPEVRAYTIDSDYAYYIKQEDWKLFTLTGPDDSEVIWTYEPIIESTPVVNKTTAEWVGTDAMTDYLTTTRKIK